MIATSSPVWLVAKASSSCAAASAASPITITPRRSACRRSQRSLNRPAAICAMLAVIPPASSRMLSRVMAFSGATAATRRGSRRTNKGMNDRWAPKKAVA